MQRNSVVLPTAAADQVHDLAGGDGKVDAAQDLDAGEGFADAANFDHSRSPAKPLAASRLSSRLPSRSMAKHMMK